MAASRLLPRHGSCGAAHTPQSYAAYSLFQCPCACLLGIADRWAHPAVSDLLLMSHEDREGWKRQGEPGLCLSLPKHFPFFSVLPVKKHLLALHCISLFIHEGKPFGGHLVVSYETQTQVTSGSDISMWLEAFTGSIFLMPYSLLTCDNLCYPVSHSPASY